MIRRRDKRWVALFAAPETSPTLEDGWRWLRIESGDVWYREPSHPMEYWADAYRYENEDGTTADMAAVRAEIRDNPNSPLLRELRPETVTVVPA